MKRFPILGMLLLVPAISLVGIVGCTKTADVEKKDKDEVKVKKEETKVTEITTETKAVVKGFVRIKGKAPEIKQEEAMKKHTECLKGGGSNTQEQMWILDNDGRVANVVVWLAPPADKKYKIDDKLKEPFKKTVLVEQPFCAYTPHVVAVLAEVQPIQFINDADFVHNVRLDVPTLVGSGLSGNLPKGAKSDTHTFKTNKELMLTAKCDVHGWMTAKVMVFPHPYFAVTKADGSFTIENIPIDTDLTVYYWHESMGALDSKKELKKASFKTGDNNDLGEIGLEATK